MIRVKPTAAKKTKSRKRARPSYRRKHGPIEPVVPLQSRNKNGYPQILIYGVARRNPKHRRRYWCYVHVLVAEKALGRRMKKGECVHHIDGDKENFQSANLLICTRRYHTALHRRCKKRYGSWHLPRVRHRNR